MISKIILIVFILFAAIQMASAACSTDCEAGTTGHCIEYPDESEYCACASGRSDDEEDCDTLVDGGCTFYTVDDLETTIPAPTATAYFDEDVLIVKITSPLVVERKYSTILVDQSADNDNTKCVYPGLYWSRTLDGCTDVFEGALPWTEVVDECGWTLDNSDPLDYIYKAELIVTHHDFTDPFAERPGSSEVERITDYFIPLQVRFPKFVEVNSSVVVTAPIQTLAAITRQSVNPLTRQATIEVVTNVLWPYKLTNATMLGTFPAEFEGDITVTEVEASAVCPNTAGSSCTQLFRILVDAEGECNISGSYKLDFEIDCQLNDSNELPTECAVDPNAVGDIVLVILSEDFCGTVDVDLDITGTLSSFYNGYSSPREYFLLNQVAYFEAVLTSDNATLTSASVGEVVLVDGENEITLWNGLTAPQSAASFTLGATTASTARFYFTLSDTLLTGITEAAPRTVRIDARIDVTYEGVSGTKRIYLQSDFHQNVDLEKRVHVENFPEAGSASSLILSPLLAAIAVLILSIIF